MREKNSGATGARFLSHLTNLKCGAVGGVLRTAFATVSAYPITGPTVHVKGDRMSDYDTDFYAWTQAQAAALRAKDVATLDLEHLAEEIASLGNEQRHAIRNHLRVLLILVAGIELTWLVLWGLHRREQRCLDVRQQLDENASRWVISSARCHRSCGTLPTA